MFIFFKFSQIQTDSIIRHQQHSHIKTLIINIIALTSQDKNKKRLPSLFYQQKYEDYKQSYFRIFSNLNHLNKYDINMSRKQITMLRNNHCQSFSFALSLKSLKCQSDLTFSGAEISTPLSVTRAN